MAVAPRLGLAYIPLHRQTAARHQEPPLNTTRTTIETFSYTRQRSGAAALALSLTLCMLFSVNLLAPQPAAAVTMAATAASGAQVVSRTPRAPQG
ncbi:MAG: hypothetical protein Q8M96_17010 [Rubrivivax sp.]|nr:hypothetical protein [Rubrivivax sp.]